jgi:hypothetical protein
MQVNTDKRDRLTNSGYLQRHIMDAEFAWLTDMATTTGALNGKQISDLLFDSLRFVGWDGTKNDMVVPWLLAEGYTGAHISDLWAAFWADTLTALPTTPAGPPP